MWGASWVAQCQLHSDVLTSALSRKCGIRFVDVFKAIIHQRSANWNWGETEVKENVIQNLGRHATCPVHISQFFFSSVATALLEPRLPHYWDFEITQRHTAFGTTPLNEGSVRRTDLYLTTHSIHNRQTSMLLARFEPAIPASERPQNYALDRQPLESAFTDVTVIFKLVDSFHCVVFVKWSVYTVNVDIGSLEATDRLITCKLVFLSITLPFAS